jgi:hypothetical protein
MKPTVITPTEPTHMALPAERFAEVVNLIRGATLQGELAFRLLTLLGGATGANFTPRDAVPTDPEAMAMAAE